MNAKRRRSREVLIGALVALVLAACGGTTTPEDRGGQDPAASEKPGDGDKKWFYGLNRRCVYNKGCRLYVVRFDADGRIDRAYGSRPNKLTYPGSLYVYMDYKEANLDAINNVVTTHAVVLPDGRAVAIGPKGSGISTRRWLTDGNPDLDYGVRGAGRAPAYREDLGARKNSVLDAVALLDGSTIVAVTVGDPVQVSLLRVDPSGRPDLFFGTASRYLAGQGELNRRTGDAQDVRLSPWIDGGVRVVGEAGPGRLTLDDLRQDGSVIHRRSLRVPDTQAWDLQAVGTEENGDSVVVALRSGSDGARELVSARIDRYGNLDPAFAGDGVAELLAGEELLDRVSVLHTSSEGTYVVARTCFDAFVRVNVLRLAPDGTADTEWGGDGVVSLDSETYCESDEMREMGVGTFTVPHRIAKGELLVVGQFIVEEPPTAILVDAKGITRPD